VLLQRAASRFATGLGREHPIENGFAWHPALGTPFLSGSSVKGLVRAWAATWLEPTAAQFPGFSARAIRGKFRPTSAGVIFFDALPGKPVKLDRRCDDTALRPYYEARQKCLATGNRAPCPSPSSPYRLARVSSLLSCLAHYPTLIALDCTPPSGGSKTRCLNSAPARNGRGLRALERTGKTEEEAGTSAD